MLRLRAEVRGAVQGVGFRPLVYRLAMDLGLAGWVSNSAQGAVIEVEGPAEKLNQFLPRLHDQKPPACAIQFWEKVFLPAAGYTGFDIRASNEAGEKTAIILSDLATCTECIREIFDPTDRRFRYPFTNCTNCGPRFSIILGLPYDRLRTSMNRFSMCGRCRSEYEDPADRRFHAQPNACPECGPHLELWDETGAILGIREAALTQAAESLRQGDILAVKGIGGFHLIVDARNEGAVVRLRSRKNREEKPLALMYHDMEMIRRDCRISANEEELLRSPASPIVLVRRKKSEGQAGDGPAPGVAPRNPNLAVMLPYAPLYHLLMAELGFPVVATSGNRSDEPICTDEREAVTRLAGIADRFLVHDRPIIRAVDDSIMRVAVGRELVIRRARGLAPLPVHIKQKLPPLVAVGAHLKNTVAITVGGQVIVSQHLGDLDTAPAIEGFKKSLADLTGVYPMKWQAVACDLHPDYHSTRVARQFGLPVVAVQHHHAHVRACMAENQLTGPALGVAWDGTGYGEDHTIWGGEFLAVAGKCFARAAHFRRFRLPGGDQAVREPRRAALGLLYELLGDRLFDQDMLVSLSSFTTQELKVLRNMLRSGLNSPWTSSVGRIFDALASIIGLCQKMQFEGQAAMQVEFALEPTDEAYPFQITKEGEVNWAPAAHAILGEIQQGNLIGPIIGRFHNTLGEIIVAVAQRVEIEQVVLSGGCFQNVYLLERAVSRLRNAGFQPFWHQRIPPNDGGIALGQIMAAAALLDKE